MIFLFENLFFDHVVVLASDDDHKMKIEKKKINATNLILYFGKKMRKKLKNNEHKH